MAPQIAPYGTWKSPLSAEHLVQGTVRFGDVVVDSGRVFWIESRPEQAGRCVIVRWTPGEEPADLLPAPFSARTTAHEYGGGALTAAGDTVYFVNYQDQRIYSVAGNGTPQAITGEAPQRFADLVADPLRNRLIAVRENHAADAEEPVNELVAVALDGSGSVKTLASGFDFVASPSLDAEQQRIAWLSWNHPNMPWDGTELTMAMVTGDGSLGDLTPVAGGTEESIFQPIWSADGSLYFISDRTNWWNLYRYEPSGTITAMTTLEADFGMPQWVFGMSAYAVASADMIVARYAQHGREHLVRIDTRSRALSHLEIPFTSYGGIRASAGQAFAIAGSARCENSLVTINLDSAEFRIVRRSSPAIPQEEFVSVPESIEFPTSSDQTAHAFYYPPHNGDFIGPADEAPPLIVMIHGGPTSATSEVFSAKVQFWTTRGFAVCDVNYRGSTGYGREYRNRLRGNWGVFDVADAAFAAQYLAGLGKADVNKLLIRGGSAGGYTTLAALAFYNVFAAGASYYGVSDLGLLATDTHKFESRYLDQLVGPYPAAKEIYDERSPIHHLDQFDRPVILFQGLEDRVVPPNQAEAILAALQDKAVPVAYVPFEGEQHGFRKAENIIRCHEAELYFYGKILGFRPADEIEPVEISWGKGNTVAE